MQCRTLQTRVTLLHSALGRWTASWTGCFRCHVMPVYQYTRRHNPENGSFNVILLKCATRRTKCWAVSNHCRRAKMSCKTGVPGDPKQMALLRTQIWAMKLISYKLSVLHCCRICTCRAVFYIYEILLLVYSHGYLEGGGIWSYKECDVFCVILYW